MHFHQGRRRGSLWRRSTFPLHGRQSWAATCAGGFANCSHVCTCNPTCDGNLMCKLLSFLRTLFSKQLSADALARKTSFVTCQPWTSSEVAINYSYIATTDVSETGISQKYGQLLIFTDKGTFLSMGSSLLFNLLVSSDYLLPNSVARIYGI